MRFAISMRKTSLKMITLGHVENPRKSKSNYLKPVARAQREVRPMYGVSSAEISLNYLHLKVNVHLTVKRKKKKTGKLTMLSEMHLRRSVSKIASFGS